MSLFLTALSTALVLIAVVAAYVAVLNAQAAQNCLQEVQRQRVIVMQHEVQIPQLQSELKALRGKFYASKRWGAPEDDLGGLKSSPIAHNALGIPCQCGYCEACRARAAS